MTDKLRPRGAGRVFLRGQVGWIQYYSHGAQVRESTGVAVTCDADWRKVEKVLRRKIGEMEAGIARDTRNLRYEDLRQSYLSDYRTNARKSLRYDKSGKPYLDKVKRLDRYFSGFRAIEIDADSVRKFIANQQAGRLSNASINRSIGALKRMFNIAKQDGKLRDVPYFPMLKESAPRQGFFESDQYEKLSNELPEYLRLPLALGYFTAMRLSEVLSLKWDQIDLLANTIHLRAGETKNDCARTIPIVPQLRARLIEQRGKRQESFSLVCFRLDPRGHAVKMSGFRKAWYSACVRVGLGKMEPALDGEGDAMLAPQRGPRSKRKVKMVYRGLIFHDLRRSGVRALVRSGIPQSVAMSISGHRTASVFRRYDIGNENDIRDAAEKLARYHSVSNIGDNSGTIAAQSALQQSSVN